MPDEHLRWRTLLSRHGAALLLYARQWSATAADAEDAVQSGFLKFWRSRSRSRDELASLYASVRGAAMDLGRGQRRLKKREQAGPVETCAFDLSPEVAERQAMIEAALRELPVEQREVIVMKIWGGLTFVQIAEALGVPMNTAASRYRYALAKLEAILSAEVANE